MTRKPFPKESNSSTSSILEFENSQFEKTPKSIRSDEGREYINNELKRYLNGEGIRVQYTVAYTPERNGVAERKNRTLIEMARCMLIDAGMDKKYWGEAVNTVNYLQNLLPTRCRDKTPCESWHSR